MMGGDPAATPVEAPAAPVKIICISQQADGSFSVYEEAPEAAEPMPGQEAADPQAPEAQTAASVDEALALAGQLLQADGRSPEEQMMAGYKKGAPTAAKPTPQAVFGE